MRTLMATLFLAFVLSFSFTATAQAERTIVVNFTNFTLTVYDDGAQMMQTPVVLPRGNYYPVPVSGTITRAEMGPTWIPTANMHRDMPGRYRQSYGPYEPGNAMGHCKISINFDIAHSILPYVRIHGNAKEVDLGQRRSRSCVRVPDSFCQQMIDAVGNEDSVRVHFVR